MSCERAKVLLTTEPSMSEAIPNICSFQISFRSKVNIYLTNIAIYLSKLLTWLTLLTYSLCWENLEQNLQYYRSVFSLNPPNIQEYPYTITLGWLSLQISTLIVGPKDNILYPLVTSCPRSLARLTEALIFLRLCASFS